MLHKADELCEMAEASGADLSQDADAMAEAFKKEEAE